MKKRSLPRCLVCRRPAGSHHPDCPKHPSQRQPPILAISNRPMPLASLETAHKLLHSLWLEEIKRNQYGSLVSDLLHIAVKATALLTRFHLAILDTPSETLMRDWHALNQPFLAQPPANGSKRSTRKDAKAVRTAARSRAQSHSATNGKPRSSIADPNS